MHKHKVEKTLNYQKVGYKQALPSISFFFLFRQSKLEEYAYLHKLAPIVILHKPDLTLLIFHIRLIQSMFLYIICIHKQLVRTQGKVELLLAIKSIGKKEIRWILCSGGWIKLQRLAEKSMRKKTIDHEESKVSCCLFQA